MMGIPPWNTPYYRIVALCGMCCERSALKIKCNNKLQLPKKDLKDHIPRWWLASNGQKKR